MDQISKDRIGVKPQFFSCPLNILTCEFQRILRKEALEFPIVLRVEVIDNDVDVDFNCLE